VRLRRAGRASRGSLNADVRQASLDRFKRIVGLLSLAIPVAACNPLGPAVDEEASSNHFYNRGHTKILFSPGGNWFEGGSSPLVGADVPSFAPLNQWYAVDRKAVFYQDRWLVGEQPTGFRVASGPYAAGTAHVYWWGEVVESADPASFSGVEFTVDGRSQHYGFDHRHVFCRNTVISDKPLTFRALPWAPYFADSSRVYIMVDGICESLGADPATFRVLSKRDGFRSIFAQDSAKVFDIDAMPRKVIDGADATSFEVLCEGSGPPHVGRDKNRLYVQIFSAGPVLSLESEASVLERISIERSSKNFKCPELEG